MTLRVEPLTGEALESWAAYEEKLSAWVAEVAGEGAKLLVFPEWAGLEFATFDGRDTAADLVACIDAQTAWLPQADALRARLVTPEGATRVRVGARARALEGQCITVQAPTIGPAAWNEAIDVTPVRRASSARPTAVSR